MSSFPIINGTVHDFGSIEFSVNDGYLLVEARSINYNDSLSREDVFVANAQKLGVTRGQYNASGSVTLTKRGGQKLQELLGPGWLDRSFNLRVSYKDTDGGGLMVDELRGVRLNNNDNAHSQGSSALESTHELNIGLILWNNQAPLDNMVK